MTRWGLELCGGIRDGEQWMDLRGLETELTRLNGQAWMGEMTEQEKSSTNPVCFFFCFFWMQGLQRIGFYFGQLVAQLTS